MLQDHQNRKQGLENQQVLLFKKMIGESIVH